MEFLQFKTSYLFKHLFPMPSDSLRTPGLEIEGFLAASARFFNSKPHRGDLFIHISCSSAACAGMFMHRASRMAADTPARTTTTTTAKRRKEKRGNEPNRNNKKHDI